jgi:hypothetical protein
VFFQSGSQGNLCDSWLDSPGGSPSPSSRGLAAAPQTASGKGLLTIHFEPFKVKKV